MRLSEIIDRTKTKLKNVVVGRKVLQADKNLTKPRSAIFYTTHKCASSFVGNLFDLLVKNSQYELVDYPSSIWALGNKINPGQNYEAFLEKAYSDLYSLHGKIYAPQRKYLDFPGRERFKHIFFLRDPRDVLVSAYFSLGFTHSKPKNNASLNKFIQTRNDIQSQGIDNYVLGDAESWIIPLYKQYKHLRETAEESIYLRYDLFAYDTAEFIKKISDFLQLEISEKNIESLIRKARPVQATEAMKHKRSGRSGQYLEKLQPTTIDKLNNILSEILLDWEFEL